MLKNINVIKCILCVFFCFFLSSCSDQTSVFVQSTSDPLSLWIVTEETVSDGMNHQTQSIIDQICAVYPNLTIRLDIVPTEEHERKIYINNLYSLMNTGNGPDVFLLPTYDVLTIESPVKYTYCRISPLFPDVNIAMRQGYFMDFSVLYDSDDHLNKNSLNTIVMNAGVVDGKRYTMPLRYDCPVMYADTNYIRENGIRMDILQSGFASWMEYVIQRGDSVLACGSEYISIQAFSHLIDYNQNEVTLNHKTVKEYLELLQQIQSQIGAEYLHRSSADLETYICDVWTPFPVQISTLGHALAYSAIAQAEMQTLNMYPIPTVDGDYVATVEYYAAIGANCKIPELAYEFIRLFLQEEAQWEQKRLKPENEQCNGLIESSWPVLVKDSVAPLWNNYKKQTEGKIYKSEKSQKRQEFIQSIALCDSDIPILNAEINIARFPVYLSPSIFEFTYQLNDYTNNNLPTNADLDFIANEIIDKLRETIP